MKKYYFKYKVHSIPYYYEFTCYAETDAEASALFILNVDGVEDYRIVFVETV